MNNKLKFSFNDFKKLDTPDLFIHLWTYNFFSDHFPCTACSTYSKYCEKLLKQRWQKEWGSRIAIERIKKCE